MPKKRDILWLKNRKDDDYSAADSYLRLINDGKTAAALIKQLRKASVSTFKAKDIFRASGLSLLGISNYHVEKDRKKIQKGKPLAPLLLVRDRVNGKVVIADGYHRLCAAYSFDEDALVPCKIV